MSRAGTCELGCGAEERLDLVRAEAHDELNAWLQASRARAQALRIVVRPLTRKAPGDAEAAYRSLQAAARVALHEQPAPAPLPEPASVVTTWWCPRCGGVDAPQPCLGICVWRAFEWVAAEPYGELRAQAESALAEELRLRRALGRVAAVTPRAGQWERGWAALVSVVTPDA